MTDDTRQITLSPEEVAHEAAMKEAGVNRYVRRQSSMDAASTDLARDLITKHIASVSSALQALKDAPEKGRPSAIVAALKKLDPDLVAYLAMSTAFSQVSSRRKAQRAYAGVASAIGAAVYDEIAFKSVRANDAASFSKVKVITSRASGEWARSKAFEAAGVKPTSLKQDITLGAALLGILIDNGVFVKEGIPDNKGHVVYEIDFAADVIEWLDERRRKASEGFVPGIVPVFAPMLEPPKPWTNMRDGGYRRIRLPLVKGGKADYANADLSRVLRATNAMQDVPLRINRKMLETVHALWAAGKPVGSLPATERLPPVLRLSTDEWQALSEDQRRERAYAAKEAREHNAKATSSLASVGQTLDMARALDGKTFWFPYQMDFRGREYAVPLFNHQGPDYMRAMIDFDRGKPLGERGAMWLGISLASLWDGPEKLSKQSFQDRYSWAESPEAEELVHGITTDPLLDRRWEQADKPFQFLRAAYDWSGFLREGEGFVSHCPVALDGSCSGIQHYSAMLRDAVGGRSVNLIPSDTPADVYGEVALDVNEMLLRAEDSNYNTFWLNHGVNRKTLKKPVMTYGYSSRIPGFTDWYASEFVRPALKAGEDVPDVHGTARYLAQLTLDAVENRLTAVAEGMRWLIHTTSLVAKEGKGIEWTTPDGFPVRQEIRDVPFTRIDTVLKGERLRLAIPGKPTTINRARMSNGIGPNFVHALDASHLRLCVNALVDAGVPDFLLIHDSFGSLAADVDTLYATVRETFVDMYEQHDPLLDFYHVAEQTLDDKDRLQLPPAKGTLDLEGITSSPYCFA